jgi:dihydroorotate dehydrogenase
VIDEYGIEDVMAITHHSKNQIDHILSTGGVFPPQVEQSLYWYCAKQGSLDLLEQAGAALPAYDLHAADQEELLDLHSPPPGRNLDPPRQDLHRRPTLVGGKQIGFPIGVSASILTRNSKNIKFFAERGFDILTYKTVRSVRHDAHPVPRWEFLRNGDESLLPPFVQPVVADPEALPEDPDSFAMANSFGIPSDPPSVWQPDVALARSYLRPDQLLVVSVVGTTTGKDNKHALAEDFSHTARLAEEAGADVVEANFSCPNTPSNPSGLLYQHPNHAGRVAKAIAEAISVPLWVKIGYVTGKELTNLLNALQPHIAGIVAINAIQMPVVNKLGDQYFPGPGREVAGVSGSAIRDHAKSVIEEVVAWKAQLGVDIDIIAVGGVTSPSDVYTYLSLGATAVTSCTGAFLNPNLAVETRLTLSRKGVNHMPERRGYSPWKIEEAYNRILKSLEEREPQHMSDLMEHADDHYDLLETVVEIGEDVGTLTSEPDPLEPRRKQLFRRK